MVDVSEAKNMKKFYQIFFSEILILSPESTEL